MADEDNDEGGNQLVAGEESHVDDSQLKLPEFDREKFNTKVASGEEEEEAVFKANCKLYIMVGKEWKERAKGEIRLLKHNVSGRVRCIVRQEKTGKVRANFQVQPEFKLSPQIGNDKGWLWTAVDGSDELNPEPTMTTFACRLKDKETADVFVKCWVDGQAANKSAGPSAAAIVSPSKAAAGAEGVATAHEDKSGPIPQADSLEVIYGADAAGPMASRYAALADSFRASYGRDPAFFVRAPGRVNLIGEHIDYHGYSVLPMALQTQDVVIAVSLDDSGSNIAVKVSNVAGGEGGKYAPATLPLDPAAKVPFEQGVQWHQYVQCGYKGAFDFASSKGRPSAPKPLLLTVDGRVPPGAGVSSSSALVVASFLAVAQANGIVGTTRMSKAELGEACRACELYIGTMSGGMDQAIAAMGAAGTASRIDFEPLKATPVGLPAGAAFVVSNCMEESAKAVDSEKRYNKRVTEGKLAAKLVAQGEGVASWKTITTFRHLQETLGLASPGDLVPAITKHLREGPYSLADVAAQMGVDPETVFEGDNKRTGALKVISSVTKEDKAFELLKRARHVASEAERVFQLQAACEGKGGDIESTLSSMGRLLTESHVSCRDDYECSSPGLDALTTLALASGAYGSRLTGAGWGGCAVSLVASDKVQSFMDALVAGYYAPRGLEASVPIALFASAPGSGAAVYTPAASLDL